MALTPVRIPVLTQANPIVDDQGRMTTEFARRLNDILGNLGLAINQVLTIPGLQLLIDQAQTAADNANAAALAASNATDANAREAALQSSYIDPSTVLSASPTTITIAAHVRRYGDGTSVNVNGGAVTATAAGDTDYVFYDDANRTGGAVTYLVSTAQPIQMGARHVVGAVVVPATGTETGGDGPLPPGRVFPKKYGQPDEEI